MSGNKKLTETGKSVKGMEGYFSDGLIYNTFIHHVEQAQSFFLQGDTSNAEKEAIKALRIKATPHLFGLLAAIAESTGHFDRANDFKMLQAFLSGDIRQWERLFEECIQQNLYYKAVVCLRRMAMLEPKGSARRRELRIQEADMLIGLGETTKAISVLVSLWEKSKYRDLEVFALLSSLYFQLGRWMSLERLIEKSLVSFFDVKRVEKPDDDSADVTKTSSPQNKNQAEDDFDFDGIDEKVQEEITKKEAQRFYGDEVVLDTEEKKRSFITLVNVHAELLNEQGKFLECVRVIEFTAAMLKVPLLELPPDLLVRIATAYAFLGEKYIEPCKELVRYMYENCPMDLYGDVVFDVAVVLRKVALFSEAAMIFEMFSRYNEFVYKRLMGSYEKESAILRQMETEYADKVDPTLTTSPSSSLVLQQNKVKELKSEANDLATIVAAAYEGYAYCSFQDTGDADMAVSLLRRAVELEPTQVAARLLLGQILYFNKNDLQGAMEALRPFADEPALHRIQVGILMARISYRAEQYMEAIALGVSIFEIILNSPDDGDTMSVAPGTKRSRMTLRIPSITRASSAILSASSLAGRAGIGSSTIESRGSLTYSVASSIRAGTSAYRQLLQRRGNTSLTSTVYGASAAASLSAGQTEKEKELLKDRSAVFNYEGGNQRKARRRRKVAGEAVEEKEDKVEETPEDFSKLSATEFWKRPETKKDYEEEAVKSVKDEQDKEDGEKILEKTSKRKRVTIGDEEPKRKVKLEDSLEAEGQGAFGKADSVVGDMERDLAELEAFEHEMVSIQNEGNLLEVPTPDSYELPTLEEVSANFKDPDLARLFLEASRNETVAPSSASTEPPTHESNLDRVSMKEVLKTIGRTELIDLAAVVVSSYSALHQFNEAKEFAILAIQNFSKRKRFASMGDAVGRPLRVALLRAAIASGQVEDAFKVATRLLMEDSSPAQRQEVINLLHVICYKRHSSYFLISRSENPEELPMDLLSLVASRYWSVNGYVQALNVYRIIFHRKPNDIRMHFIMALGYLFSSQRKGGEEKHESAVSTALVYFQRYQALTTRCCPARTGEALYNTARAMQLLGLDYLAAPLYERILQDLVVPQQCSPSVRAAAQFNLYYIYRWTTSNRLLALEQLPTLTLPPAEEG